MENKKRVNYGGEQPKRFFDLEEVRSLPIKDVCAAFGIPVERSNFIKLRPSEKTASTKLYINKGKGYDRFHDFGTNEGGDCINLIENWRGCSWQQALEAVADAFGIQPVNNFDYEQRGMLSDVQWAKIGIYGDLVTKNLDFDLERFSVDSAMKYASKYQMTVNQLRETDPNFYIAAILRNKAFPFVYDMRNSYFMMIYQVQSLIKHFDPMAKIELLPEDSARELEESRQQLTKAEKLLKMALRGTDVRFSFRDYNLERDWEDLLQGKISFEIGPKSNIEIKQSARKDNLDVLYKEMSADEYFDAIPMDLSEVSYAAFLKGDKVNLVYTSREAEEIEKLFDVSKDEPEHVEGKEALDLLSKINDAENKKGDVPAAEPADFLR